MLTEQVIDAAWGTSYDEKYWETNPGLPISVLKSRIEEKIQADFKADGRVSISSIYEIAKAKPFGLMPCNITAFILGFVLREYSSDQYRYTDDQTSDVMSSVHLQVMIDEIIKNQDTPNKRYRDKYIVTMTPEEKEFHHLASIVFDIPFELCASIQITRDRVRNKMKGLSFPIWTLKYTDGDTYVSTEKSVIDKTIDLLSELANSGNTSEVDIANSLGKLSLSENNLIADLTSLATKENCRKGMAKYLAEYKDGEIIALSQKIKDGGQYLNVVASKFTDADAANWVWNQATANQRIDEVIVEYKIIDETNSLFGSSNYNLRTSLDTWKNQCNLIRISYDAMKDKIGSLAQFMSLLKELKTIGQLLPSKQKEFYTQLSLNKTEFKAFFENQKGLFEKICAFSLESLESDDVDTIFKGINPQLNAFIMPKADYVKLVDDLVFDYKKNQKKEQLKKLWREKTGTESPREWSEKFKTPILCMIPANEIQKAKKAFSCFGSSIVSDTDIKDALTYFDMAKFFENLKNQAIRDESFKNGVLKEYATILTNVDEIREYLLKYFLDVYDWHGDNMVEERIKSYAEHEYTTSQNSKVIEIINGMGDAELKQYLVELAQDNVLLGIQILKNKR